MGLGELGLFGLANGGFGDPFTGDLFGWIGGGRDQTSLMQMFGGPSQAATQGALQNQYNNLGTSQGMWNTLFQNAQDYYGQTEQGRNAAVQRMNDLMAGNYDPSRSPAYGPMRNAVESSYNTARENILANLPQGGVMQEALADVETQRAGNLSDIMSQILTGELQNAYGMASGSYGNMIQGLNAALQGGAIPGQMMGSILEYLTNLMNASVAGQNVISPF
jgi:hypothetical protein